MTVQGKLERGIHEEWDWNELHQLMDEYESEDYTVGSVRYGELGRPSPNFMVKIMFSPEDY